MAEGFGSSKSPGPGQIPPNAHQGVDPSELQQVLEAHANGSLDDPLAEYRDLHARGCRDLVVLINLAQLELAADFSDQAVEHAQAAVDRYSSFAPAWLVLGVAQRRLGNLNASIGSLRQALKLDPDQLGGWVSLSVCLHDTGELNDALQACQIALKLDPASPAAWTNLSMVHLALAQVEEAYVAAKEAIRLNPQLAESYLNLGNALHAQEAWVEAIGAFRKALALKPDLVPALSSLGNAFRANDQLDDALDAFDQALTLRPDYFQAHSNRAITLRALGRVQEGLTSCQQALKLASGSADVHSNHGVLLHELGLLNQAEHAYRHAIALDPEHCEAQFSLSMLLLQQGNYTEGWQRYEWRFAHNARHPIVEEIPGIPHWAGPTDAPLNELVLLHEQGLGDSFQFLRFAPLLRPYARRVLFCAPKPLKSIVASSALVDEVRSLKVNVDSLQPGARTVPLMSVPGLLGLKEEQFAETVPYFSIDLGRTEFWRRHLQRGAVSTDQLLIALNWQGNPNHEKTTSRGRSIPLEALAPLADLPGVRFVSLQKGFGSEQLANCSFRNRFVDCQPQVDQAWDFEDAAALMHCADLTISSDTSAAHLAGAIGTKVWILLKRVPEWRWGLTGSTTPWYPTARLFRQAKADDWSAPVAEIRVALEEAILSSNSS